MEPFELKFTLTRATKHTYRYEEQSGIPKVGVLYVQKHALGEQPPDQLVMTIKSE